MICLACGVLLLAGSTSSFASTSDRAIIRSVVMDFYRDLTGRGGEIFNRIAWPDSPLANANNVYGAVIHDDFRLNDIRIWISGNRAVVSAHTSEARYNPEGSDGLRGPRDICARQLELRRRGQEWRMYQIMHVHCRFVEE